MQHSSLRQNELPALAACEAAVRAFEDSGLTNCGRGANLTCAATAECDAAVMLSSCSNEQKVEPSKSAVCAFGAVGATSAAKNPISAASAVLRNSYPAPTSKLLARVKPMLIVGSAVEKFLRAQNLPHLIAESPDYLVSQRALEKWSYIAKYIRDLTDENVEREGEDECEEDLCQDTVGAVAMDCCGNICAAVSSGGILFKDCGRVGEAGMYGCGVWAQSVSHPSKHLHKSYYSSPGTSKSIESDIEIGVGCSLSGTGEQIMRTMLARQIAEELLETKNKEPALYKHLYQESNEEILEDLLSKDESSDSLRVHDTLRKVLLEKFCYSPLLEGYESHLRNIGVVSIRAVIDKSNGRMTRDVWYAHTTEAMGVGWMSGEDTKATVLISRKGKNSETNRNDKSRKRKWMDKSGFHKEEQLVVRYVHGDCLRKSSGRIHTKNFSITTGGYNKTRTKDESVAGESRSGYFSRSRRTQNDNMPPFSISSLPTASPHAVIPHKRPSGSSPAFLGDDDTRDKINPKSLAASIRRSLASIDPRRAWAEYKMLHMLTFSAVERAQKLHQKFGRSSGAIPVETDASLYLDAEDHAQMLASLTQHLLPSMAAANAELVVLNMLRARIPLDVRDYNNLMLIYARNKDLRSVIQTFDALLHRSPPPLRNKVSMLPKLMASESQLIKLSKSAKFVAENYPVKPNLRTFQIIMSAYASTGRVEETYSSFALLKKCIPTAAIDASAYMYLISAHANASRRSPTDLDAVNSLLSEFLDFEIPDRRVLDAAVRAIGVCGDLPKSVRLFESYPKYGILEYGLDSIDALMSVYEVHGLVDDGEDLYSRFFNVRRRIDPDANGEKGEKNLLSSTSAVFPMPLASTIKSLMRLNKNTGKTSRVVDLFEKDLRATQIPDAEAHEILLVCHLSDGDISEAERVFARMLERGYKIESQILEMMDLARESAKYS
ncbi:taspase, threonine aspartase, 1 [Physocladia obscura]|uniref:Taspase, threonine aspartase, 1 n=1 Tax=Physocladia obscura TaxID=109957 RepID=A0AAD5T7B7_9FUNG|nr:taspase, threonine aspartase, 1 [Physocladia obscura]